MKQLILLSLLCVVHQAIGQGKPDDIAFQTASDSAMRTTMERIAPELSRLTDMSAIKSITRELQQTAVSEKDLFLNRLYRKTWKRYYRAK